MACTKHATQVQEQKQVRSRRTQGGRRVGFHGRKQDTGSVSRDIHRARDEATVLVGTHPAACWMTFGWRSSIQCFISVLGGAAAYRCLFAPARLPRRVARAFGRHNARRETTGFCEGSAQVEETEREGEREGASSNGFGPPFHRSFGTALGPPNLICARLHSEWRYPHRAWLGCILIILLMPSMLKLIPLPVQTR